MRNPIIGALVYLLITVDLVLTIHGLSRGAVEANPMGFTPLVTAFKNISQLCVVILAFAYPRKRSIMILLLLMAGFYSLIAIYNVTVIQSLGE